MSYAPILGLDGLPALAYGPGSRPVAMESPCPYAQGDLRDFIFWPGTGPCELTSGGAFPGGRWVKATCTGEGSIDVRFRMMMYADSRKRHKVELSTDSASGIVNWEADVRWFVGLEAVEAVVLYDAPEAGLHVPSYEAKVPYLRYRVEGWMTPWYSSDLAPGDFIMLTFSLV